MLCGARVGGYTETSELKLGRALLEDVPDDSLLILDRGYVDWSMLDGFADAPPAPVDDLSSGLRE